MNAPAARICPLCSGVHAGDCTRSRRHPPVRVTRLPRQADAVIAEANTRAWAEHDPTSDRATEALAALDAAAEALRNAGLALVRNPTAAESLRLQLAEEALLRATDALRGACRVQP